MPSNLKHFAVHAGDVGRGSKFYEQAFGWQFTAWGPLGFFLIKTGTDDDPGVQGALQSRREVVAGKPMFGFECTLGVESIDDTINAVEANGGKIVMPKFHIPRSVRSCSLKTQKETWSAPCSMMKDTLKTGPDIAFSSQRPQDSLCCTARGKLLFYAAVKQIC